MRRGRVKREARLALLRGVPLFAGCSQADLGRIAAITEEMSYDAGTAIVREGEAGCDFFVVVEGEAEVRRGRRSVNVLASGEFFGEIALVSDVPRTATIVALTPLLALTISERDFTALLTDQPAIARKVLRELGERLAANAG